MKLLGIMFLLIQLNFSIKAQNLVLNYSFEDYRKLPSLVNTTDSFFCMHWYLDDESSPDYYNANSRDPNFGIPKNLFGNFTAKSGNGYIGIIPLTWDGYMEHITGEFKIPLERGKSYKIGYYIRFVGNSCKFFASNFGAYLSINRHIFQRSSPFYEDLLNSKLKSQIKSNSFITDTCWQLIEGYYIAKGGERYITLGIFYEEDWNFEQKKQEYFKVCKNQKQLAGFYKKNQNILLLNQDFIFNKGFKDDVPYYFIDDVFAIEIEN